MANKNFFNEQREYIVSMRQASKGQFEWVWAGRRNMRQVRPHTTTYPQSQPHVSNPRSVTVPTAYGSKVDKTFHTCIHQLPAKCIHILALSPLT